MLMVEQEMLDHLIQLKVLLVAKVDHLTLVAVVVVLLLSVQMEVLLTVRQEELG